MRRPGWHSAGTALTTACYCCCRPPRDDRCQLAGPRVRPLPLRADWDPRRAHGLTRLRPNPLRLPNHRYSVHAGADGHGPHRRCECARGEAFLRRRSVLRHTRIHLHCGHGERPRRQGRAGGAATHHRPLGPKRGGRAHHQRRANGHLRADA